MLGVFDLPLQMYGNVPRLHPSDKAAPAVDESLHSRARNTGETALFAHEMNHVMMPGWCRKGVNLPIMVDSSGDNHDRIF